MPELPRALWCGQHEAADRIWCGRHSDFDHCEVTGRAALSADEERALMDEARQAFPDGHSTEPLHWTAAMAQLRRRYVSP